MDTYYSKEYLQLMVVGLVLQGLFSLLARRAFLRFNQVKSNKQPSSVLLSKKSPGYQKKRRKKKPKKSLSKKASFPEAIPLPVEGNTLLDAEPSVTSSEPSVVESHAPEQFMASNVHTPKKVRKEKLRSFSSVSTTSSSLVTTKSTTDTITVTTPKITESNDLAMTKTGGRKNELTPVNVIEKNFGSKIPAIKLDFDAADPLPVKSLPVSSTGHETSTKVASTADIEELDKFRRASQTSNKYIYNNRHYNHTYVAGSYNVRKPSYSTSNAVDGYQSKTLSWQSRSFCTSSVQKHEYRDRRISSTYSSASHVSRFSAQSTYSMRRRPSLQGFLDLDEPVTPTHHTTRKLNTPLFPVEVDLSFLD